MEDELLKDYLKLIYYSKGITYKEFCLRSRGSLKLKNKWLRFLIHHHYICQNDWNKFFLSQKGKLLFEKIVKDRRQRIE
ncbi:MULTISPECIES: hypothetical protein [unclassified Enterococcus]|uniref:hypothetical protein n=1 Tax=unclassified Enterococcus TaxID=2608891 RepID=UPI0013EA63A7|nr:MULTISPECIES: hypothetical protein [unclassified Enterococcus]